MKKMLTAIAAFACAVQAWGELVSYVDEQGVTQQTDATVVVSSGTRTTWHAGWYAVTNDVTIAGGADVNGAVKLILMDGAKLTINDVAQNKAGIRVSGEGRSFTVYGQTEGTGLLDVTGGNYGAGIGGGSEGNGSEITINGGRVTATGKAGGAGIGGGWYGVGSEITINGGTVTATGGWCGAGIGGGRGCLGVNITINGGTVTAKGGFDGAGIGGGDEGAGSDITITGGMVTATGREDGAGIGGGNKRTGSNITITGGMVTATGGDYGAGIGSGGEASVASSGIIVADGVLVRAGSSANPTEVIPHASSTTDIASLLAGKRYVTAETIVVYPSYLEGKSEAVRAKFEAWAEAYPPGDPDGIYTNAFLFNVATNREAEALAAFKIGSISITNEVVGMVTNTVVVIERAQPLPPATAFNGVTWLQCATNGLGEAEWLDIGDGRYTEKEHSFIIQRIDFEHTLTPEAFPTEPTGGKTMRVKVVE